MVKIKRIYIKNYRSIVEADIEVKDFNVFVGLNDSGKSNVLKALDLFFNYKKESFDFFKNYSKLVHYTGHRAKEIIIALTLEIPAPYRDAGEIVWTKRWTNQSTPKDFSSTFNKEFTARSRTSVLLDRIVYEYIPAVKSKDYFKDLLSEMYDTMLTVANSELKDVNNQYSDKLKSLTSDLSVNIKEKIGIESHIKMPDNLASLFRDLLFETKNEEKSAIDLFSRGDGIQARHIPAILKFIYDKKTVDAKERTVPYTVIWGYEEPENGIEMSACFDLVNELFSYNENIQLFITSHSPAFYGVKEQSSAQVLLTYKEAGKTLYMQSSNKEALHKHIGMMPLIQPFVDKAIKDYQEKEKELLLIKDNLIQKLKVEVDQERKGRIIIITEGKTDIEHIRTAFSQLSELNSEILNRIDYYDFGDKGTLGDELKSVLDSLTHVPTKNIIIGIFDRDKAIFPCAKGKAYIHLGGNVYKFNIPALNNEERKESDKICIEHYYKNDEIKTMLSSGRLYMGNDFDEYGTSLDKDWSFEGFAKNKSITPIKIIDRENSHIERKSATGKMATKNDFSTFVSTNPTKFDFKNFTKVFDIIREIVENHSD